jgi:stress response protein YsnF
VVTEEIDQTVPVQREEVRVEREPITEANADQAMSGPEISEEEHEVVLTRRSRWSRSASCRRNACG